MAHKRVVAALASIGLIVSCTAASAMVGVNCLTLSDYYRALGTVENGDGTCGMSMEEANRILGRAQAKAGRPAVATPRTRVLHRKRHVIKAPSS